MSYIINSIFYTSSKCTNNMNTLSFLETILSPTRWICFLRQRAKQTQHPEALTQKYLRFKNSIVGYFILLLYLNDGSKRYVNVRLTGELVVRSFLVMGVNVVVIWGF